MSNRIHVQIAVNLDSQNTIKHPVTLVREVSDTVVRQLLDRGFRLVFFGLQGNEMIVSLDYMEEQAAIDFEETDP